MSLLPSRASSTLESSSAFPSLPLISLTAPEEEKRRFLTPLPSAPFAHSRWCELRNAEIKASQLHCPRIRQFPKDTPAKKKVKRSASGTGSISTPASSSSTSPSSPSSTTANVEGDNGPIPASSSFASPTPSSPSPFIEDPQLRAAKSESLSNWSSSTKANLSYQDLHDGFQRERFVHVLRSLDNVVHLVLVSNGLHKELRQLVFNHCKVLHLERNLIESFGDLPKLPQVEEINLDENHVVNYDGMKRLSLSPHMTTLSMRLNPVFFNSGNRGRLFKSVASLKSLDGISKQPEDESYDEKDDHTPSVCSVC